MKTVECTKFGPALDALKLQQVNKPIPTDEQVLIRIDATSVTAGDCEIRNLQFNWLFKLGLRMLMRFKTVVLGMELAGEVEAVGKGVTGFKKGDHVYASPGFNANAEYICLGEKENVALKPANMTITEAAVAPVGALNALHFLQEAKIKPGEKVLVFGASGSIGTFAVQIAKHFGAHVTGICSTTNLAMVKNLGADHVIDYTKEDFTQSDACYDVILDTLGKAHFWRSQKKLKTNGRYLLASPCFSHYMQAIWLSFSSKVESSNKKAIYSVVTMNASDLIALKTLIETANIKSVIDRTYPLEQLAQAHQYVEKGHKKGNVVITVCHD